MKPIIFALVLALVVTFTRTSPVPVPVAIAAHDEVAVPVPDLTVDLLPPREDSAHFWGMKAILHSDSGDLSRAARMKRSKSGRRLQHRKGSRNIFY